MKDVLFFTLITLFASMVYASDKKVKQRMKPVLIIIDIQNQFLPYIPEAEKKLALDMINSAIWLFRQHGFPIIRVYHTDAEWGPQPDSKAFKFPASVKIIPEDPKIVKNYPNAFKKTGLEKLITDNGHNTLFLCGLSAVGCVLATYHGAMDLDFNVVMIKDALMSHKSKFTNSVEEIFDTVSFSTMKFMLEYAE